jgi:hypothetical protein
LGGAVLELRYLHGLLQRAVSWPLGGRDVDGCDTHVSLRSVGVRPNLSQEQIIH